MYCTKCGNEIISSARFCKKCGSPNINFTELVDEVKTDNLEKIKETVEDNIGDVSDGFDIEWVSKAIKGEPEAQTNLYNYSYKNVYLTVKAIVKDKDLAQDIVQNTFIKALSSLNSLDKPENFNAWVKKIGHNEAINELRKNKLVLFSQMAAEGEEDDYEPAIEDTDSYSIPENAYDKKETSEIVNEILDSLSEGQRMTIGMYYYEELSINEIAEKTGLTTGTIKAQLHRGRKAIEDKVKELEKNGTKLYSFAPFTFFIILFKALKYTPYVGNAGEVVSAVAASSSVATVVGSTTAATASTAAATATETTTAATTAATTATAATATGTAAASTVAAAASKGIAGIAIKIATVALIGGGLLAGFGVIRHTGLFGVDTIKINKLISEYFNAYEEQDIDTLEELCGDSKRATNLENSKKIIKSEASRTDWNNKQIAFYREMGICIPSLNPILQCDYAFDIDMDEWEDYCEDIADANFKIDYSITNVKNMKEATYYTRGNGGLMRTSSETNLDSESFVEGEEADNWYAVELNVSYYLDNAKYGYNKKSFEKSMEQMDIDDSMVDRFLDWSESMHDTLKKDAVYTLLVYEIDGDWYIYDPYIFRYSQPGNYFTNYCPEE